MADENRPAIGGGTGGTAGTGELDASRDSDTKVAERGEGLADKSVEAAIGEGGPDRIGGTGSSVANSGRSSTETEAGESSPADPGDPGGMGGVRAGSRTPNERPPGGVSPIGGESEEKRG